MKAYSTVSWIVSVPPKMEAQLIFTKLSQPKCINRHTNIRVQRMGSPKEDYSHREDEVANSELTVSESFYLNMSNCLPERGNFSVITKISLQKSNGKRKLYSYLIYIIIFWFLKNRYIILKNISMNFHENLSRHSRSSGFWRRMWQTLIFSMHQLVSVALIRMLASWTFRSIHCCAYVDERYILASIISDLS